MTEYTFDMELFSDFYKDTFGFRPRGHIFYSDITTDDERQRIWDGLMEDHDAEMDRYERQQNADVESFEILIDKMIGLGASCRKTAIRWITENFDKYDRESGYLIYYYNLPFSYKEEFDAALG